jgi:hypothetical protein
VKAAVGALAAISLFFGVGSTAQASLQVSGFYGSTGPFGGCACLAGELNLPQGVAVNSSGTGAPAGTTYVADVNNRISQFDPAGNFVRTWGVDVVSSGQDQSDAVQRVTVDATGGSFKLTFGGETTSDISATASAATLQTDLNALPSINSSGGSVSIEGGPGNAGGTTPYLVIFDGGPLQGVAHPKMTAANGVVPLSGGAATVGVVTTNPGGNGFEICNANPPSDDACQAGISAEGIGGALNAPQGVAVNQSNGNVYVTNQYMSRVDEFSASGAYIRSFGQDVVASGPNNVSPTNAVQTLTVSATGGKYTLKFGGQSSGEIEAGSGHAAAIQTALQGLTSIGAGNATVAEGSAGVYAITFAGALASNPEPLIATESGPGEALTGGTAVVENTKTGGSGFEVCTRVDLCKAGVSGENGGAFGGFFNGRASIAPVGAPNAGNVVVADPGNQRVQEFTSSGGFVRAFGFDVISAGPGNSGASFEVCEASAGDACKQGTSGSGTGQFSGGTPTRVAEDSTGAIYTVEPFGNSRVQKFSPQAGPPALSPELFGGNETQSIRVSATSGQFRLTFRGSSTPDLSATSTALQVETALNGLPSISSGGGSVSVTNGPGDATGSSPYLVTFAGAPFARTNPAPMVSAQGTVPLAGGTGAGANQAVVATPTPGGPNGSGSSDGPVDITIGAGNHVFVSKNFPQGSTPKCLDGSAGPADQHLQELTPAGSTVDDNHGACNEIKAAYGFEPFIPTSGLSADPITGFVYESKAPNGYYTREEPNRVYVYAPGSPPVASLTSIDNISTEGATINGTVTRNSAAGVLQPVKTVFHIEYKLASDPTWTTYGGDAGVGSGPDPIPVSVALQGLEPNRSFEVRLVATKPFHGGVSTTVPQSFSTLPSPPRIEAFHTSNITANSADLHALINPLGQDTKYFFEYGTGTSYGSSAPAPVGEIPAGTVPVSVTTHVTGLNGGVYHFRVVAENEAGISRSGDQTFTFYPPECPNESVRQQTGASLLPDCRAYELVSPSQAGNVILTNGGPPAPEASGPSRFAYSGFLGGVKDSGEPTSIAFDVYIATRTTTGWVTKYSGIHADTGTVHGGPPDAETDARPGAAIGSLSLDKVIDWDYGQQGFTDQIRAGSYAPFMFDSNGNPLGQLPTNVGEVPGATLDLTEGGYNGDSRPSPDFSHYVFSTADLAFAAGGLTSAPGSVYDNDLTTKSVTIVSHTSTGDIPPGTGGAEEVIRIPAVSTDGSHILMSTKAGFPNALSPVHLYMSIDDGPAYDVSIGQDGLNHGVTYVGMNADGKAVYFESSQQLTSDDHDTSNDLFMWNADDPSSLTRISKGTSGGDSDQCAASWAAKCSIATVHTEEGFESAHTDNFIAPESGDIYFYSPEQLVPGKGVPGQKNLYVYRDGALQYVTVFAPGGTIDRMQVVPDGRYMAMLTREKLTLYNNAGFEEMYTYDANSGAIQCVSCVPDGSAPTRDVEASQNGIFLTDDGRAFFTTGDPLVPEDINAKLRDVYEFVDNRPQLITSGSAPTDSHRGPLGLVGVSRDGTDVYFTTVDSLVKQDLNGPFLKFYDARTGGGFPFKPPPAPCGAADECHGPASGPPPPVAAGTGVPLGSGGNATKAKRHNQRKHKHHRHHRPKKHSVKK